MRDMSWHTDQLKYAFGLSGLISFYGIVSIVVWFVGDRLSYDMTYRIVVIAVVLLTLPFALVIGLVVARRNKKAQREAEAGAQATEQAATVSAPQTTAPKGVYDEISRSAEEVAQFLKTSNLGAGKAAIYSLPWYLIFGPPKTGKTSLLLASGLNFQNLPSQRESEQKFIRPTRGVDWRVTSEAVFVDTAGRYQTEGLDKDEWSALLDTIKNYRAQRALDGMILTVNTERIIAADEKEIEEQAKILRARLDECTQKFKLRVPVYLVFTNADSIEGFRDSFSTSQREGENLVWGSTFPIEKSESAHALFDSEFDLLQSSAMKRRLIRLSAPFDAVRQLRIFNFPLHFGGARRKLGTFVNTLFRPNPFSQSPFLRGFYFTAVPQSRDPKKQAAVAPTVSQTFFTRRFFYEVVLRDKDLVATLQAQKQRPPIFGWVMTLLGGFFVALLLGLSAFSLYENRQMLNAAADKGEKVLTIYKSDAGRNPFTKTPDEARVEIDAIDNLRKSLVELDDAERNGAPWYMRFGLYSGNRIYREKLLPIYFNAVEQRFKNPVVRRLEDDLRKFSSGTAVVNSAQLSPQEEENLGKNYDLLKAYLMLSGEPKYREHAEPAFLAGALEDYWKSESKLGAGLELSGQQQLDFWSKQVTRDQFPFIKLNSALVDQTRKKLQAFPAVYRYYKRVTTDISKKTNEKFGDMTVANILTQAGADTSFIEGSYRVPNVFTIEGRKLMDTAIKESDQKLSADDWVMGEAAQKSATEGTEAAKLQERYYRDYTDEWRKFVKGISIKNYKNQADADRALQAFSSANSPLAILLKEIGRETNLSAKQKTSGWIDWLLSFVANPQTAETGGNSQVERDFRPLFSFVGTDDKPDSSQLGKLSNEIQKVYNRFHGLSTDEMAAVSRDLAQDKDTKLQLKNSETSISNMVTGFEETPAGQELANVVKKPLGNLRALLGAGAQSQLDKAWTEQILPKAKDAERGYPFDDSGEADLTKLTAYLNPVNGSLSKFYSERLEKYFEESGGQLKLKETSDVKFSDEFLAYLNNAFRLREALYGKNASATFAYDFKLNKVIDSLIEVTIDGQKIDSNGTGSTNFKFPASSGETGAFMNFASMSETVSTAGSSSDNTSGAGRSSQSAGGSSSLKFPGSWGLFKFFEAGAPKKQSGGEYLLTYRLGGKTVTASVRPTGGDLFDRNLFRSVHAPQKFLK